MTMRHEPDIAELSARLNMAGKSLAPAFAALAQAAREAGEAAKAFRVACWPDIPDENHPIVKQMRAFAENEGKILELVRYPRHIGDKVFGRSWMIFDELADLDWSRRTVVRWRGKTMVFRA